LLSELRKDRSGAVRLSGSAEDMPKAEQCALTHRRWGCLLLQQTLVCGSSLRKVAKGSSAFPAVEERFRRYRIRKLPCCDKAEEEALRTGILSLPEKLHGRGIGLLRRPTWGCCQKEGVLETRCRCCCCRAITLGRQEKRGAYWHQTDGATAEQQQGKKTPVMAIPAHAS
jgi:hypothetical protein